MKWYDPIEEKWHDPPAPKQVEIVNIPEDPADRGVRMNRERRLWDAVVSTSSGGSGEGSSS